MNNMDYHQKSKYSENAAFKALFLSRNKLKHIIDIATKLLTIFGILTFITICRFL